MRTQDQNVRAASKIFRFQVEVEIPIAEHKYSFPGKVFNSSIILIVYVDILYRELLTKVHQRTYRPSMASKVSAKSLQPEERL